MSRLIIDPQLYSVIFHVEDTIGQAWEVVVDDNWSKSGSGDTIFNTQFSPGDHTAILRGIAFPMQIVKFTVKDLEYVPPLQTPMPQPPTFPKKPGESYPPSTGEHPQGKIGTQCEIVSLDAFGKVMFRYRNIYTGVKGGITESFSTAVNQANNDPACFLPAPPTPKDWQDGIQKQVTAGFDAISKYVTDGLKSVTESWQNGILDLEARMKAWIETEILSIIWAAITRDRKEA